MTAAIMTSKRQEIDFFIFHGIRDTKIPYLTTWLKDPVSFRKATLQLKFSTILSRRTEKQGNHPETVTEGKGPGAIQN
jgi:hypothetical protein